MKQKKRKTFYNWLTNRYQLIIRNEENFAEKTTVSFNYARVIVISFVVFALVFISSLYIGKYFLSKWYNPDYEGQQRRKEFAKLITKIEELEKIEKQNDEYIRVFKKMLMGGEDIKEVTSNAKTVEKIPIEKLNLDTLSTLDKKIREEYETVMQSNNIEDNTAQSSEEGYFPSPITAGKKIQEYDKKKDQLGISYHTKGNADVKSIEDGKVMSVTYSEINGWIVSIQHKNNIVSIYKYLQAKKIKKGQQIKSGEVIGKTIEPEGDKTVNFAIELWLNGGPMNPEVFIEKI